MFLIDRRFLYFFDWKSFFTAMGLALIGLMFVFSATYKPEEPFSTFFKKEVLGILSGLFIYVLFSTQDPKNTCRMGYFAFFAVILLLFYTKLRGSVSLGGQRWINIGFTKFQPSELAKLFLPAFLTYYFYTQNQYLKYKLNDFTVPIVILGLTFLLILKQPDLGTALIFGFSATLMLWFLGLNKKVFLYGALFMIISAPVIWMTLKDYQRKRIEVFLGEGESHKERYQIEQSKIAIGSGGIAGKGFLKGTQNKLSFLPEGRTDFIFSVMCEELGFLGALFVLLLFLSLFLHLLNEITQIKDFFSKLLAIGLLSPFIFSTIINIGMVIGLLPIVGIPLPLMSYGISHLWTTFACLGWINSIIMRSKY
ncbi:MAG: Rod shape-determining protein [candidate division TM6 bacterium GW2011_GWF2_32_72]|nr:MAG: Rod shape-determining protein [candidate division TM6 bacterium GW2011_GWF2_32_72]